MSDFREYAKIICEQQSVQTNGPEYPISSWLGACAGDDALGPIPGNIDGKNKIPPSREEINGAPK